MIKPNINIFEFDLLYQIFFEIKENLPFKITRLVTNDIKDSNNHEDFRFFLDKFPESPYAIPAKLRLKQLEREEQ